MIPTQTQTPNVQHARELFLAEVAEWVHAATRMGACSAAWVPREPPEGDANSMMSPAVMGAYLQSLRQPDVVARLVAAIPTAVMSAADAENDETRTDPITLEDFEPGDVVLRPWAEVGQRSADASQCVHSYAATTVESLLGDAPAVSVWTSCPACVSTQRYPK